MPWTSFFSLAPSVSPVSPAASFPPATSATSAWWARWHSTPIAPRWAAVALGLWCTLALNQAWWRKLAHLSPEQHLSAPQYAAIGAVLAAATTLWLLLLSWPLVRRVGWSVTVLTAAAVQYFMLHYGIVVDPGMVRNALQTNTSESLALLGPGLAWHLLVWAGLPLCVLWTRPLRATGWKQDGLRSALLVLACMATVVGGGLYLYKPMAPLVRNHTDIRYLINPLATVVSVSNVTLKPLLRPPRSFQPLLDGAQLGRSYGAQPSSDPTPTPATPLAAPVHMHWGHGTAATLVRSTALPPAGGPALRTPATQASQPMPHRPPLLVLVVGETTRADHFGLNGYPRNTTPQLEARHTISWRNVQSCGTNTLASVPCMFSHLGKRDFENRKADYSNLLDILQAAGLSVDWLDNQSGCKDVCNRVPHAQADAIAPADAVHRWCQDSECLDQMMVELLDQRLQSATAAAAATGQPAHGVVLVLHAMGSHGPAYYRRSSVANKRFVPECTTHVTSDCSPAQLINVYDNSMLETDTFVARTIDWLRTQQGRYETGLMYLSDHGESLGENGLYLHGLPYLIAPQAQTHVPWVLWPGSLLARTQVDERCVRQHTEQALTHDHFFHTVLGLLDVRNPTYQPGLDALQGCRPTAPTIADAQARGAAQHPTTATAAAPTDPAAPTPERAAPAANVARAHATALSEQGAWPASQAFTAAAPTASGPPRVRPAPTTRTAHAGRSVACLPYPFCFGL